MSQAAPEPHDETAVEKEIHQTRAFHSLGAVVAVSILRTAAVIDRYFGQVVAPSGITIQQYNVLRILRGAGAAGLPTLIIRDRMIHEAPGITRLVDKLEQAGLVRRERSSPDRRQVLCHITQRGLAVLKDIDAAMNAADDAAVSMLTAAQQQELVHLLDAVRAGHHQQTEVSAALAATRKRRR